MQVADGRDDVRFIVGQRAAPSSSEFEVPSSRGVFFASELVNFIQRQMLQFIVGVPLTCECCFHLVRRHIQVGHKIGMWPAGSIIRLQRRHGQQITNACEITDQQQRAMKEQKVFRRRCELPANFKSSEQRSVCPSTEISDRASGIGRPRKSDPIAARFFSMMNWLADEMFHVGLFLAMRRIKL